MAKSVLTPADRELQRKVEAAVRRATDAKRSAARKAAGVEQRRVKAGLGATFLGVEAPAAGGAHTEGRGRAPGPPMSPPIFPLPQDQVVYPQVESATQQVVVWAPQPGPQYHFIHCPVTDVVFGGARYGGKGLLNRSGMVLTPFGFRPVTEMKVGTNVCAVDGTVTQVIGVYPRGKQPAYRCHFSDGSSIEVDGGHIWQGWRAGRSVKKGGKRTGGAEALRNYSMDELLGFVGVEGQRLAIPLPAPVAFNVAGQLVGRSNFVSRAGLHPYVLGVLLGDGCLTSHGAILYCSADTEIPARVASLLGPGDRQTGPHGHQAAKGYRIASAPARATLEALGVMGKYAHEKAVPRIYLMASVEERWELLRGLMDTDGWAEADGDIYFTSTSRRLAEDVRWLARSLGGSATWREKEPAYTYRGEERAGRRAYTVRLVFPDNTMAFSLERKRAVAAGARSRPPSRHMESIEPLGEEESTCIAVAHPSSLFIANDFLVTHNTYALIGDAAIRAGRYGAAFRGLFIRRHQVELADVKAKMQDVYAPIGAKWSEQHQTWTFPGGGVLILKYLSNDEDALLYKGWNITALYVDEIGDFPNRSAIDKLWGAMRSAAGIPVVRRMSCNPGGPGHMWVKETYISQGPYKVFWYTPNPDRPDLRIDAVFIPSRLEDNRIAMKNDPTYEAKLAASCGNDQAMWKAWRYGDWDGLAGTYFSMFKEETCVSVPPPMPDYMPRWVGIDWGYGHPTAVVWYCDFGDRGWQYRERLYTGTDPCTLGQLIAEVNGDEKVDAIYLSPDAFAKRTSENTVATELSEGFRRAHQLKGLALMPDPTPAMNDRVNGWQALASAFASGRLQIAPTCTETIRALQGLVRDMKKPDDCAKVDNDDAADAARYAWATRRKGEVAEPIEVVAARVVNSPDPNVRAMQERMFRADPQAFTAVSQGNAAGDEVVGVTMRGRRSWRAMTAFE